MSGVGGGSDEEVVGGVGEAFMTETMPLGTLSLNSLCSFFGEMAIIHHSICRVSSIPIKILLIVSMERSIPLALDSYLVR